MLDWLGLMACTLAGACDVQACREVEHARVNHIVCSYKTEDVKLKMFLRDGEGMPYGRFGRLKNDLQSQPLMLMNGGMYHDDLAPVGLYVEKGEQAQRISTKGGWGNFHLLPNGVFWVKNGKANVSETGTYLKNGIKPDFATQSGPMLVIDGKLHPRFLQHSDSLKIRNGVGVSGSGRWLHFAISRRPINFWNFGTLFRDVLDTPNALFLDGSISTMKSEKFNMGGWLQVGPIIGVFDRGVEPETK